MTRVVASLTTIPERVKLLPAMLESLTRQTQIPQAIYLQIPQLTKKGASYDMQELNQIIARFSSNLPLVLHRPQVDLGPITKFAPVLDLEPDPKTWIILLDDDVLYDSRLIETLMNPRYHKLLAAGFAGRDNDLTFKTNVKDLDGNVAFLETFAGVRYQRSLFPGSSSQFLAAIQPWQAECRNTDDIILGKWVSMTPLYILPFPENATQTNPNVEETPQLRDKNLGATGQNQKCFQSLAVKDSPKPWVGWVSLLGILLLFGFLICQSKLKRRSNASIH